MQFFKWTRPTVFEAKRLGGGAASQMDKMRILKESRPEIIVGGKYRVIRKIGNSAVRFYPHNIL